MTTTADWLSNSLRVLIVGCGNIAGGFDQERPSSEMPFTHAGAYAKDGRFTVTACVEPDDNRRIEFMKFWGVPRGKRSISELLKTCGKFDVVSICSPTEYHAQDIEETLYLCPKLIFCEKPIAPSLSETQRLVKKCRKKNILLAVNYTRRWDPYVSRVQNEIHSGRWGALRSIVGFYNKGILNNGSHMFDLLHMLIGSMEIVTVGKPVYDFTPNDPTVPVWLKGEQDVSIHITCSHAKDFALFELQLVFSNGVLTMEDGGMFWRERRVVDNALFAGYRTLDEGVRQKGEYTHSMCRAVDNIYCAIRSGDVLASSGETALLTQRLCEQVIQQISVLH